MLFFNQGKLFLFGLWHQLIIFIQSEVELFQFFIISTDS